MNGLLIVGGYDPKHGLDKLHSFRPRTLQPGETMMVVFVSDVVDDSKDASVTGVRVEYSSGDNTYAGTIPWTYTFDATTCDR